MRYLLLLLASGTLQAATLDVEVRDNAGAPVADAIAYALPKAANAPLRKREVQVEQIDKQFVPLVTVVQTGTAVQFPNRDPVRHHVYSFSPPKPFELKLYAGTPEAPIVFDKPGEVVLGCNIHDHMVAYIFVVDTPWFAKTGADGKARIEGLGAGEYEVKLWHPRLGLPAPDTKPVRLRADETAATAWSMTLRAPPPRRNAPSPEWYPSR
jgi:plastocyanin